MNRLSHSVFAMVTRASPAPTDITSHRRWAAGLAVLVLAATLPSQAARLALVMGDGRYDNIREFDNSAAEADAEAARRAGYEVDVLVNRKCGDMLEAAAEVPCAPQRAVRDPNGRTVSAAPFRRRVVHQALCHAIGLIFERGFLLAS